MNCVICNTSFSNVGGYTKHLNTCKSLHEFKDTIVTEYINGVSSAKLSLKYNINKNSIISMLKSCGVMRTLSESTKLDRKLNPRITSESTRKKQSIATLQYMKNNPHKTAWRKRNKPSYPEVLFMKMCTELNLQLIYDIEREYPMYPFYIDFAFVNANVAIEVDGSQHWLDSDRMGRDRRKEQTIRDNNWRIMRIPEFKLKHNWGDIKQDLLDFLSTSSITEKKYDNDIYHYQKIKLIKSEQIQANKKHKHMQLVLSRHQDFTEIYPSHGWSVKLGKCWGMSSQASSRYCKKYFNIGNIHNIISKEAILECFDKKMSINSIGRSFNLSSSTISEYCKKYNIDIPDPIYKVDWNLVDLKTLLKTKPISMIAHDLNVTYTSVRKRAKKLGII